VDDQVVETSAAYSPAERTTRRVQSGALPPLADSYYARPESGPDLAGALVRDPTIVLADDGPSVAAGPAATGGTGKTQLAVELASNLWRGTEVDLLVWINASGRDAIITGYAQASADLGNTGAAGEPESAAARFLDHLAGVGRPWLIVLDDVRDVRDMDGLWPSGPSGRVLVTERGFDPAQRGDGRTLLRLGLFTRREAVNYLTAALKDDPDLRPGALDLVADLGCGPIAMAQATAVMRDARVDCREYRALFAERRRYLVDAASAPGPLPALVSWSLAVDRAGQTPVGSLAWPLLALAAYLDPGGVPASVLTSAAACGYLVGRPGTSPAPGEVPVGEVVRILARLGLLVLDPASTAHTVRMHSFMQHAVRSFLSAEERDQARLAAASAIVQGWPRGPVHPLVDQALRDCTMAVMAASGDLMWRGGCHPVLIRAGDSLDSAGLVSSAAAYWQDLLTAGTAILGPRHADILRIEDKLAGSSGRAGRPGDAISAYQRSLADREGMLGHKHPDTVAARARLAHAYLEACQLDEAIGLYETVLAERVGALGSGHTDSLAARRDLAQAYLAAGRAADAIRMLKINLAERERARGPSHPDTITARSDLADGYRLAGSTKDALAGYERTLTDRERILGPAHPDTLSARANLAFALRTAGRMKHAIPVYQHNVAERERWQGTDHPDTLTARTNLAAAYHTARRPKDAIALYEGILADRERIQGPDQPDTLTARANLASAYHSARRLADAIPLYERAIAEFERVLGADHPDTLASRSNLGHAYYTIGRMTEATTIFENTLADCERALGPDHPLTQTMRENLEAATQA
jgi:tetratricopeptide (TPR) repeat protein